jgi:hypothetical protein
VEPVVDAAHDLSVRSSKEIRAARGEQIRMYVFMRVFVCVHMCRLVLSTSKANVYGCMRAHMHGFEATCSQ